MKIEFCPRKFYPFVALLSVAFLAVPTVTSQTQPAPASPPQNSGFRAPANVSDLLDVCSAALTELDTHPAQVAPVNLVKFGWCLGWAQGIEERIVEVHMAAKFDEMNSKKESKPAPTYGFADKDYMSICLPPETRPADIIRTIVNGLPARPGDLHEPKNGPVKAALKKAYPCPAAEKEGATPPGATP